MKNPPMRHLLLLTGPRGSGKSTWCDRIASHTREMGLNPGGLLSPAIFHNGKKIGIDLLDIATRDRRQLTRKCAQSSQGIRLGDWCFDPNTLDWGNQILTALKDHDLLLLDELGPLEFEKGLGLMKGLQLIDEKAFHQAVVVIRPELLKASQNRWPDAEVVDISCVESILQLLEQEFS
jgi:nucleoside-triphosphatase